MIDFIIIIFFSFFFFIIHFFPRLHYPGTKRGAVVSTTTEAYGGRNTAGVINNTDMFEHGMQHRLLQVEMEKRDVVFVEKSVWMMLLAAWIPRGYSQNRAETVLGTITLRQSPSCFDFPHGQ